MTTEELFIKADEEMKVHYESGRRCIEDADTHDAVRFYRDVTQGEIEGISSFTMSMYLTVIYDHDNNNRDAEEQKFFKFNERIRERSRALKNHLNDYAVRFL